LAVPRFKLPTSRLVGRSATNSDTLPPTHHTKCEVKTISAIFTANPLLALPQKGKKLHVQKLVARTADNCFFSWPKILNNFQIYLFLDLIKGDKNCKLNNWISTMQIFIFF
jgi:hypothetical protein